MSTCIPTMLIWPATPPKVADYIGSPWETVHAQLMFY